MNSPISTGRYCFVLVIIVLLSHLLYGQKNSITYGLESDSVASPCLCDLPFLIYDNTGGTVDQQWTNFINRFFRLNTGFDGVVRLSQINSFHFIELYKTAVNPFLDYNSRMYSTLRWYKLR